MVTVIVTEEGTEKISVRLLFPTYLFSRNMLDPNLDENQGYDLEYNDMLVEEVKAMRKRDPMGRLVSNSPAPGTKHIAGWQSNDGCERNPTFQKCMNKINQFFIDEVLPFHGLNPNLVKLDINNAWANINDKGAWNAPHLHNGCWYSGVFYIHSDGDEGRISMIDTHQKVVGDFPHSPRTPTSLPFEPITGECILFPSGLMHMVEPNPTNKERYSISFNCSLEYLNGNRVVGENPQYNPDEFLFDLDVNGNPIR